MQPNASSHSKPRRLSASLTPLGGSSGEECFKKVKPRLRKYPVGTIVMLNLDAGRFVAGSHVDELGVISRFRRRFGKARGRIIRLTEDESGQKQADWLYRT